jgi:prevent-host-death family protein
MMHTWQLQEAKSRFSEVVDLTLSEGPQMVTRHGKDAVVILSVLDYRRMSGVPSLVKTLLGAPRGEPLVIERDRAVVRDVVL